MDKPTALQALSDVSAYVAPIPNSADASACLASVASFIESQSDIAAIAPPSPPVITTAMRDLTSSGQIKFISAATASPIRDVWADQSLVALKFTAPRDVPMLIEDIKVDSCRELIGCEGGSPAINNVTVRRCDAKVGKRGIYIRYNNANWLVEDVNLTSRLINKETGVIPMGVQIADTAHDLIFRRVVCENFITDWTGTDRANDYWNADGFVAERGNYNILFEDCVARNCTDGGFDFKATNTRLERCLAEGCARSYRFWTNNHHGQITSRNPIKRGGSGGVRHVGIYGSVTELIIDHFIAEADTPLAPLFVNESAAPDPVLILGKHDFRVPAGTPMFGANARPLKVIDPQGNPISL
jgi:hypothetical protein